MLFSNFFYLFQVKEHYLFVCLKIDQTHTHKKRKTKTNKRKKYTIQNKNKNKTKKNNNNNKQTKTKQNKKQYLHIYIEQGRRRYKIFSQDNGWSSITLEQREMRITTQTTSEIKAI